jgi:hypothetical protein
MNRACLYAEAVNSGVLVLRGACLRQLSVCRAHEWGGRYDRAPFGGLLLTRPCHGRSRELQVTVSHHDVSERHRCNHVNGSIWFGVKKQRLPEVQ